MLIQLSMYYQPFLCKKTSNIGLNQKNHVFYEKNNYLFKKKHGFCQPWASTTCGMFHSIVYTVRNTVCTVCQTHSIRYTQYVTHNSYINITTLNRKQHLDFYSHSHCFVVRRIIQVETWCHTLRMHLSSFTRTHCLLTI